MTIDLARVLKFILPKRRGDQLLRFGFLVIVACIFGGYEEYRITPLMQVMGIIAGFMLSIFGGWISHERSKYKSSRNRKPA